MSILEKNYCKTICSIREKMSYILYLITIKRKGFYRETGKNRKIAEHMLFGCQNWREKFSLFITLLPPPLLKIKSLKINSSFIYIIGKLRLIVIYLLESFDFINISWLDTQVCRSQITVNESQTLWFWIWEIFLFSAGEQQVF